VELDFDGNAIGGLAIGEDRDAMFETTGWLAPQLPADRPRYFMGIGDPEGILGTIEAGVDMFDCVLPTRTARTGSALTWEGRLNLRNARFARDPAPLDESCDCPACSTFSRAYIRHPRQPGGAARPPAALAPQSTLRPGAHPAARGEAIARGEFGSFKRDSLDPALPLRMGFVIVIAILVAIAWILIALPARRRQRSHGDMQDAIVVGDEIITAGGIHGVVREAEEGELQVEIAPGVVVTLDRRAVAASSRKNIHPARRRSRYQRTIPTAS